MARFVLHPARLEVPQPGITKKSAWLLLRAHLSEGSR